LGWESGATQKQHYGGHVPFNHHLLYDLEMLIFCGICGGEGRGSDSPDEKVPSSAPSNGPLRTPQSTDPAPISRTFLVCSYFLYFAEEPSGRLSK